MNPNQQSIEDVRTPLRTTLLDHVQSLTDEGLMPDEVVRVIHESLDSGRVVLIGNFRGGLGVAAQVRAAFRAPTRRRKGTTNERSDPSGIDSASELPCDDPCESAGSWRKFQ